MDVKSSPYLENDRHGQLRNETSVEYDNSRSLNLSLSNLVVTNRTPLLMINPIPINQSIDQPLNHHFSSILIRKCYICFIKLE